MFVIIISLWESLDAVGPFVSQEDAQRWVDNNRPNYAISVNIVPIQDPAVAGAKFKK